MDLRIDESALPVLCRRDSFPPPDLSSEVALARWLVDLCERISSFQGFVQFDPVAYARTLVARSHDAELVLIGWLPEQETPIHDHGGAIGAAIVLAGELEERSFVRRGPVLVPVATRHVTRGGALAEGRDAIHAVRSPRRASVSLHVYTPPLAGAGLTGIDLPVEE